MSPADLVELHPRAREAFVALPARARPGSFWQLDDGQVVRVAADGRVEQLVLSGRPWGRSLASDPCAARSA